MLLDDNYRGRTATPSAANVFVCTPMICLSRRCHAIVRGFRNGTAMTTLGVRSKSTGRGIRKLPRQDATQTHCVENGQRSLPTASAGAFGTELSNGAGIVLGGVEVRKVALEKEKNSFTYRHRLRHGMSRFQDFIQRRGVTCAWWLDLVVVNQRSVDLANEMHENTIALCHARHTIVAV